MNRKILIISPYFPPSNAADMQRIRMSLSYFESFGWDASVVTVDKKYADIPKDDLLLQSIPAHIKIHTVKALNKAWTSKFGLGSIALRSLWFYLKKVNKLLKNEKFDLIYFSTTQFPVCVLGAYWKKHFGVPFIIDMQDPWYSDYYSDKPKEQQPPKYFIAYYLHKYLEPVAIKSASGLISVSEKYISDLKNRYPEIADLPSATITFGAYEPDLKIAADNKNNFKPLLDPDFKNVVYIGRGGMDMHEAIAPVFKTIADDLNCKNPEYRKLKFYFIGTSYAADKQATPSILPLARQYGIEKSIIEITNRISYYYTLLTLQEADALFIPGSDSPAYTASKIFPYLLINKPLLAIFNSKSPAINTLQEYGALHVYSYDDTPNVNLKIKAFLTQVINGSEKPQYNATAVKKYSAQNMTQLQCSFFNEIING